LPGGRSALFNAGTVLSGDSGFFGLRFLGTQSLDVTTGSTGLIVTTAVFRDVSAWYHIVLSADTTIASNQFKLYVNGVLQGQGGSLTLNTDLAVNSTVIHELGRTTWSTNEYLDGYLADIHFIDGQALDPTSFGEFDDNGIWQPKAFSGGSYGTNGFHLDFADNASTTTIGYDAAGSNDWTANNLSVTAGAGNDSLVDVPTNGAQTDTGAGGEVRGNYATLNPLANGGNTLSNGNLKAVGVLDKTTLSTIGITSGKWYCEVNIDAVGTSSHVGIAKGQIALSSWLGDSPVGWSYASSGQKFNNNSGSAYGNSYTTGDVISIAFDADAGSLFFYKNGTVQNSGTAAFTGLTSGPYFFAFGAASPSFTFNFGQRPFAYTAPSGFKALNTANLPAPLVTKPSDVMDVKLYTGNGGTQVITTGFSPDLVWIKSRSVAYWHRLNDSVRGAQKFLYSNATDAEGTSTANDRFTSFDATGFTLGIGDDPSADGLNQNTLPYVAWCWDAGSSTVTNTDGSISSQVRANASAGFSVVTYTGTGSAGATVGHGLGVAPQMIIVKNRDAADAWQVYHSANTANPETDYLVLNTTAATADALDRWNDTAPTSTVFSLGDGVEVNTNTEDYVAYCWTGLVGYSSGFSYTGNGSADGVFQYLGFRPRLIMLKRSDSTSNWTLLDTSREGYNVDNDPLYPNLSDAEGTTDLLDITSNGFKLRSTDASVNASAATYIGFAWAEAPFAYSRAR
jgi:hypothetical protein